MADRMDAQRPAGFVLGINRDQRMVAEAQRPSVATAGHQAEFRIGQVPQLNITDESFDRVQSARLLPQVERGVGEFG
jgi:ubiquinone/menaquinone biosynthesis C-methylase UbiE